MNIWWDILILETLKSNFWLWGNPFKPGIRKLQHRQRTSRHYYHDRPAESLNHLERLDVS